MVTLMPADQVGRYSCPACPLRFESLADKKQHLREQHPKQVKR